MDSAWGRKTLWRSEMTSTLNLRSGCWNSLDPEFHGYQVCFAIRDIGTVCSGCRGICSIGMTGCTHFYCVTAYTQRMRISHKIFWNLILCFTSFVWGQFAWVVRTAFNYILIPISSFPEKKETILSEYFQGEFSGQLQYIYYKRIEQPKHSIRSIGSF